MGSPVTMVTGQYSADDSVAWAYSIVLSIQRSRFDSLQFHWFGGNRVWIGLRTNEFLPISLIPMPYPCNWKLPYIKILAILTSYHFEISIIIKHQSVSQSVSHNKGHWVKPVASIFLFITTDIGKGWNFEIQTKVVSSPNRFSQMDNIFSSVE